MSFGTIQLEEKNNVITLQSPAENHRKKFVKHSSKTVFENEISPRKAGVSSGAAVQKPSDPEY